MNLQTLKGYVLVVLSAAVLLAVLVLILLQWGNVADFSLYGRNMKLNTALLIALSAAAGVLIHMVSRLLIYAVRCVLAGRREGKKKELTQRVAKLEKAQEAPPESEPKAQE